MFEVTGADISNLGDADLRTLVARLALAELRKYGQPLSSVVAGGNQDAADGGLDVCVQCPNAITDGDFVPRSQTGFQVKKTDMSPQAIMEEMRPAPRVARGKKKAGQLREAIRELADKSGAYIIVSSQGSLAYKRLEERRRAIRDALHDLSDADRLRTDFYDRDRVATWVNEYPGIAAWVRNRVGLGLSGWGSIGEWKGTQVAEEIPYLFNDKACLSDERSREHAQLTISEGIACLRAALRTPKRCIRLVGLSGLGKTRLVQALFESEVGDEPLDPGLAVYADYSVETNPTARDMARQLVLSGQRAILVVDNCNPSTHSLLASICSASSSNVSLITVEYDVREDEPERTEVFRLRSVSPGLVEDWLKQSFPDISQIDRLTITDFSDGNFRVARALAETLGKGETLGKLKSQDLFERLFQQRNGPDQSLLSDAEDLSLLYSVNGEDASDTGELALIGGIRAVDPGSLYATLAKLGDRGIAQARNRWRAILPQAIANRLATSALQRIPPDRFDRFSASLTPRMQKSLSRRLGYLHDSREAQAIAARWLQAGGPLGDLMSRGSEGVEILTNIAPVSPEAVLKKIGDELDGPRADDLLSPTCPTRARWINLVKALGYEVHLFDAAASLLASFLAREPADNNHNSARDSFAELFHLYLSGTQATPDQRRAFVRQLANSKDVEKRRCALVALNALLKAAQFSSSSNFDFGARSRAWGWEPKVYRDLWGWHSGAISLAIELSTVLDDARSILASNIRDLWSHGGCYDDLELAADTFIKEKPWVEGWLAFREVLRFDGESMADATRKKLESIIQKLRPCDLLHQARAIVLNRSIGGWDVADSEPDEGDVGKAWHRASLMAVDIGRQLAQDAEVRGRFLPELMAERQAYRAFECGRGLALGAANLGVMWRDLIDNFEAADPSCRGATVLGGFINEAFRMEPDFALRAVEDVIEDTKLARNLPYLQARIAIDADGIERLRRGIKMGVVEALDFTCIASGVIEDAPPEPLGALLLDISDLANGVGVALDILCMYFYCNREDGRSHSPSFIDAGRTLLRRINFSEKNSYRDYQLHQVVRACCSGGEGEDTAREICSHILDEAEGAYILRNELIYVIKALLEVQPNISLDVFLLSRPGVRRNHLFESNFRFGSSLDGMDSMALRRWADYDAASRYPIAGKAISMFQNNDGEEDRLSPLFLKMLDGAPDKRSFLGDFWFRLHPRSWSGSLADILVRRREQLLILRDNPNTEVRAWIEDMLPELDRSITAERQYDRAGEESFE